MGAALASRTDAAATLGVAAATPNRCGSDFVARRPSCRHVFGAVSLPPSTPNAASPVRARSRRFLRDARRVVRRPRGLAGARRDAKTSSPEVRRTNDPGSGTDVN
jgi:hypothetical protein